MELSLATLDSSNSIRLSRLMSSSRRLTRVWWSILTAIDSLASPDMSDGMSSCREMSIVSSEKKLGFDFLLITFCQRQKWWHKLLSYLFLLMVLCNEVVVCGFLVKIMVNISSKISPFSLPYNNYFLPTRQDLTFLWLKGHKTPFNAEKLCQGKFQPSRYERAVREAFLPPSNRLRMALTFLTFHICLLFLDRLIIQFQFIVGKHIGN